MMRRMTLATILFLLTAALLAACGGGSSDEAPKAVEAYLQALVDEDSAKLSTLSCKDWEEQAMMELDSFIGVDASLKDAACKQTGSDGDTALVECSGSVQATYGNEQQELPLSGRTYKVVKEGGESLVCGYQ
jgi:hypothetical protein